MPHRRRISVKSSASVEEEIKSFILAKKAKGLADKTLATYAAYRPWHGESVKRS